jgi:hypothetical protein
MIYIIFGPSKTGTTSLYKLLLQKKLFPILYTHDMKKISITDHKFNTLEWQLGSIGKKNRVNNLSINLIEYCIEVDNKSHLIEILKQNFITMINTFRNPIDRRMSQLFHTLSYENLLEKTGKHDVRVINEFFVECNVLKYAIKKVREIGHLLTIMELNYIIDEWFSDEQPYELIDFKNTYNDFFKDHNNVFSYNFDLDNLNTKSLMQFLNLPENTILLKERDMMKKQYLIAGNLADIKDYVKSYMLKSSKLQKMITNYNLIIKIND